MREERWRLGGDLSAPGRDGPASSLISSSSGAVVSSPFDGGKYVSRSAGRIRSRLTRSGYQSTSRTIVNTSLAMTAYSPIVFRSGFILRLPSKVCSAGVPRKFQRAWSTAFMFRLTDDTVLSKSRFYPSCAFSILFPVDLIASRSRRRKVASYLDSPIVGILRTISGSNGVGGRHRTRSNGSSISTCARRNYRRTRGRVESNPSHPGPRLHNVSACTPVKC